MIPLLPFGRGEGRGGSRRVVSNRPISKIKNVKRHQPALALEKLRNLKTRNRHPSFRYSMKEISFLLSAFRFSLFSVSAFQFFNFLEYAQQHS